MRRKKKIQIEDEQMMAKYIANAAAHAERCKHSEKGKPGPSKLVRKDCDRYEPGY